MSEAERAMSCADVKESIATSQQRTREVESVIQGNRHDNQVIGYVATLTIPPLALAANHNSDEKKQLDRLQSERDRLYVVWRLKDCG